MLSPTLEKQRHRLFAQTVQHMGERLRSASDAAATLAALRWGMQELDRTFVETPAKVKATVACRAGCDFCCRVPMDVQAHEVFFAAEHIQATFPPADLAGVIERTAAHRTRVSGLYSDERGRLMLPCALLRDGRCSSYEGRPEVCRAHHTSNAAACSAHLTNPDVAIEKAYIPALRSRMYAVMLGIDEAMEEAGFDGRAYDFGSALHEALTNSLCQVLWMRRKPAFPDSCLASPLIEDGPPGG
jgi:Fe-S-cluster containining protein